MKCFLCGKDMVLYFEKVYPYQGIIENAKFVKCPECGLVVNETVYEMPQLCWEKMNDSFHGAYQGTEDPGEDVRLQKWIRRIGKQAKVLFDMFRLGIFKKKFKCLDYGCGDGKLSDAFSGLINGFEEIYIHKYDKFMATDYFKGKTGYLKTENLIEGAFDVVITTAVFEHLIGKQNIDSVVKLLKKGSGVLCTHTLVCEEIPCDPEWFYIKEPVHCTLWSNNAMKKLFTQYGFKGCAYCLEAQMWLFFFDINSFELLKSKYENIEGWFFDYGFVDYWKQKPYHYGKES